MKEIISLEGIRRPGPFNHVVKAGNLLFLTSQLSCNLETNEIIAGTVAEQTKRALENMKFLLEKSGSKMENVVKVNVYMRDVSMFDDMNNAYRTFFEKDKEPARVTVQAASPLEGIDIEIDAIAVIK